MDFNTVNVAGYEASFHERLFLAAWLSIKDLHSRNDHIALPEVYKSLARTRVSRTTSALNIQYVFMFFTLWLFQKGKTSTKVVMFKNMLNHFEISCLAKCRKAELVRFV